VLPIDWTTFIQQFPQSIQSHFLCDLALPARPKPEDTPPLIEQRSILHQLEQVAAENRHSILLAYFQEQVAKTLALGPSQLDISQPLNNLGLDSLMAVELRNQVKSDLGVDVSMVKFMEGLSLESLVAHIIEQLSDVKPAAASSRLPPSSMQEVEKSVAANEINSEQAGQLLAQLDTLDDEKVDELLKTLLTKEKEKS
jgi:microcystin synthetase protein McyG